MLENSIVQPIASIVLAAGKGLRMGSDLPKVLHPFKGKPLLLHVIESLKKAGIGETIVVVGYRGELVIEAVGDKAKTVWQREQLGTGHAVMQAEEILRDFSGKIIIACGDVPLIKPETFASLVREFKSDEVKAIVLTMKLDNPEGYGRIVKDGSGNFVRIVEDKDATSEEKKIQEVNTGTYVFEKEYLFAGLKFINTDNAQGEYYLPDALNYVIQKGHNVLTIMLENPIEGRGINTRDELLMLEKI